MKILKLLILLSVLSFGAYSQTCTPYYDPLLNRVTCPPARPSPIGCIFGDAATGSALTTAETCYVRVPKACKIVGWSIMADAGTATVKTWRVATGGTAIPTVANSISTSGVSLSSGTAVYSTTVTDWTSTAIAANDWLAFNLAAVATAKQITFQIDCQ